MEHPHRANIRGSREWIIVGICLILFLSLLNVPYPFHGDQAFFMLGALKLNNGENLYRDFWDLKQPGIFWFFWLGGKLFGFNEIGVHILELLWLVLLALVFLRIATKEGLHPIASAAGLVLSVGAYCAAATQWHLTQLEILVSLPLLVMALMLPDGTSSRTFELVKVLLVGITAAVVLIFKMMFVLIIVVMLGINLLRRVLRTDIRATARGFAMYGIAFVGFALSVIPIVAVWAQRDMIGLVRETFFKLPPAIIVSDSVEMASIWRLASSVKWFLENFAVISILGVFGFVLTITKRKSLINWTLGAWLLAGCAVFLMQRTSWWQYHLLLLIVPLGYLSAIALDVVWYWIIAKSRILKLCFVILVIGLSAIPLRRAGGKLFRGIELLTKGATETAWIAYTNIISTQYRVIRHEDTFLRDPTALPGDIVVLGDPLHMYLSGRNQAVAMNGWALEFYLHEQWKRLETQLDKALPPYIFVSDVYRPLIVEVRPQILSMICSNYSSLSVTEEGEWYRRR